MTESPPTQVEEPLDYPLLVNRALWAMCRYDLTGQEMLIVGKIVGLSFTIGRPFAWLQYQTDLAELIGRSRSKVNEVLGRLKDIRAIEKTKVGDGWILTFLPPSKAWDWTRETRYKDNLAAVQRADRLEAELLHVNRHWPMQMEFLPVDAGFEFEQALAIEKMRESLISAHRHATEALTAGLFHFPVTDRSPTPAPARMGSSSGEGLTRPRESGRGEDISSCPELSNRDEEARTFSSISSLPSGAVPEKGTQVPAGSETAVSVAVSKTVTVPEKGTDVFPNPEPPFKSFKDSKLSRELLITEALKSSSRKRNRKRAEMPMYETLEPLDPGAKEPEVILWLRYAIGEEAMVKWGGWWRLRWREEPVHSRGRRAVLNACYELRLRLADRHMDPLRNRGGWLRDKCNQIFRELEDEDADINPPTVNES